MYRNGVPRSTSRTFRRFVCGRTDANLANETIEKVVSVAWGNDAPDWDAWRNVPEKRSKIMLIVRLVDELKKKLRDYVKSGFDTIIPSRERWEEFRAGGGKIRTSDWGELYRYDEAAASWERLYQFGQNDVVPESPLQKSI